MELDILFGNCDIPPAQANGSEKEKGSFERECVKIVWKNLLLIDGT